LFIALLALESLVDVDAALGEEGVADVVDLVGEEGPDDEPACRRRSSLSLAMAARRLEERGESR
jgi:hypothetical protein